MSMAQVIIYTKSYCPYCKACKEWLHEKKIAYDEKVIDKDNALSAEMQTKSGDRSDTPQVFINGHHIGSFDDLKALESQGELEKMLKT